MAQKNLHRFERVPRSPLGDSAFGKATGCFGDAQEVAEFGRGEDFCVPGFHAFRIS